MDREELIKIIVARAREYHAIIPVVCRKMIADDILDQEQKLTEKCNKQEALIKSLEELGVSYHKHIGELKKKIAQLEKENAEIDESFKNLYVEFEEKDNELIKLQQSFTESKMPEKREMIEHICIGKHGCRACHIAGSNMALGKCRLVEQMLRGEIASEKSMREFYQDKYWKLKNLLNGDRLRIAVGKVVLENNRNVTVEQVIKAIQGDE